MLFKVNNKMLSNSKVNMRIGIDNISPGLSTSRNSLGGMRHFLQSFVSALPVMGATHQFELFSPVWADPFKLPVVSNITAVSDLRVPQNRYARAVYEQFRLPRQIEQRALDIWLGTCNTLPLKLRHCRTVLIVQSVQYYTHPEAYTLPRRTYLTTVLRLSLAHADAIVVFSQANKDQLVQWFGISPQRIHVIHHAFRFPEAVAEAVPEEREDVYATTGGPYILCVSAFYAYKNLHRLIEAFACLRPMHKQKLVLAGAPTKSLTVQDIMTTARQFGVEQDVICLGRVADEQLLKLYRNATLMAMPSLDETFGLPVLEAMAFGCPVVTSNLSSMPEIAGSAAVLVDPYKTESIAKGMREVLTNPERHHYLVEAGRARAQLFTYDRFFNQLMMVLEETGKSIARNKH